MATTASTTKKKRNVAWNGTMDGVFLAALKNQIAEGQETGAGFKECAYNAVAQEVSDVLNKTFTKDNVKNRLKTLKTTYRTLNSIINLSGFGWDETLCKISVDEEVKNDYLKLHPEKQRFFSKRYPLYKEMKAICDDDYARGEEKSKKRLNPALLSELHVVSSSINRVADAIISTGEVHSLPDLKDALLNIAGFAKGELIDAYVYLHGHHKEAEAFLSLDEMDRVDMLRHILRRLAMQL
ncbi:uncharacterized protein LOC143852385 [Tasmannia lanceolata]|uniref:uncharacterized protein LOC143852385 n=1 Tax=Tasmannia lanceolata TaxID=3420 RepID=UPI004064B3FC